MGGDFWIEKLIDTSLTLGFLHEIGSRDLTEDVRTMRSKCHPLNPNVLSKRHKLEAVDKLQKSKRLTHIMIVLEIHKWYNVQRETHNHFNRSKPHL
jgi:hypothetical protein